MKKIFMPPEIHFKKKILPIVILLFIISLFSIYSCKKNSPPDCGCDAPTSITIPESDNIIGTIEYNKYYNDVNYKNKFTIIYIGKNCINCVHTMFICNEGILPQQVLDLKFNHQSLQVKFAGDLKPNCEKITAPGDYTYENIYLTKIITL